MLLFTTLVWLCLQLTVLCPVLCPKLCLPDSYLWFVDLCLALIWPSVLAWVLSIKNQSLLRVQILRPAQSMGPMYMDKGRRLSPLQCNATSNWLLFHFVWLVKSCVHLNPGRDRLSPFPSADAHIYEESIIFYFSHLMYNTVTARPIEALLKAMMWDSVLQCKTEIWKQNHKAMYIN